MTGNEYDLHMQKPNHDLKGLALETNSLLKNYIDSIGPYLDE
jgi:AraC family transcriptional regulator, exoenzyme S synthesis regulatory protein ExsA